VSYIHFNSGSNLISSRFYVYDTISELAFGEKFGSMKSGSDITGLAEALHDGAMAFALMGRLYPITKLIKKTFIGDKYLIPKSGDPNGIGTIMTVSIGNKKTTMMCYQF